MNLFWNAVAIFGPADRRPKPARAKKSRPTTAANSKASS